MAINLRGLPIVPGARTLTSGGPPIALNNEIRGGIHRISGDTGDQLGDIDRRYLQVGMLVYDETQDLFYMYKNQAGDVPTGNPDSNDPYRGADGRVPNDINVIGGDDSNWVEFRLGIDHTTLESLSNVSLADGVTPAPGQVLEIATVDNTDPDNPVVTWQNAADNPLNNSIEQLSDVNADGRVDGQVLRFHGTDSEWQNAFLALTDIQNIADDIAMAQDGDGFGFSNGQWRRRPNATPPYPVDQLIVEDSANPGQFIGEDFLYELHVSIGLAGNRVVDWMETPGQVNFTLQDRPMIDEGETAFRRAPGQYVVIGFDGEQRQTVDPNIDAGSSTFNDIGPIVWGQPDPDQAAITRLVGTQPALFFFGENPDSTTQFPAATPEEIQSTVLQVTIDYQGVIRNADGTKQVTNASADAELQRLIAALPAGEYTGIPHTGLSLNNQFINTWLVGFTELIDRDGVVHRIPEPPNPEGRGIHFGTDNPAAATPIAATATTVGTTQLAGVTPNDPVFVFQHGGQVTETSIAGSQFIESVRIPGGTDTNIPYDRVRISPTESIGITARAADSTAVENPNGTGGRAEGEAGHDHFTEVRAGTGIQIRAAGGETDAIEIINEYQEQDSDIVYLGAAPSIPRADGALVPEFLRNNDAYVNANETTFNVDVDTSIVFDTTGTLNFTYVALDGVLSAHLLNLNDIVQLNVNGLSTITAIPQGVYSGVVNSIGGSTGGSGGQNTLIQISVGNLKRQQGGPDLPGPATDQTETSQTFTMTVLRTSRLDVSTNTDVLDPFLYSLNDPAIGDNSAVRFVGGRGIDVFSNDATRIDIASNTPTTEYLDVLTTVPLGTNGNVDNLIITGAETDLSGNPITSTLSIPVVDSATFNAPDDANTLRLTRNGRDDIVVNTFGAAASSAVTDVVNSSTSVESLPTVAGLRAETDTLRREIENTITNQKLEDHHGVQPVFTQGGSTPIPQAQRNVLSDAAHIPFRTDTRSGILDVTFSTFYYDPLGALVIIIQGSANTAVWTGIIDHLDNGVVNWRGRVAGTVDGETPRATVLLADNSTTIQLGDLADNTAAIVIEIEPEYRRRFTDNQNNWLLDADGNYYFISHINTLEAETYLANANTVTEHNNLNNVVYVRNSDPNAAFEWEAQDFNVHGFFFLQSDTPPTERETGVALQEGDRWRDTGTGRLYVWNVNEQGNMWVQSGGVGQITTDFSGYPTFERNLPTTEDQPIIYFTGSSTDAEGLYRWDSTRSAYLPGPRRLDFRRTLDNGSVQTAALDVDTATFSNNFTVSTDGEIDLISTLHPEDDIARILTNLPTQDTAISTDATIEYWIEIDSNIHVATDITVRIVGHLVTGLRKIQGINNHLGVGDNRFVFTLSSLAIGAWNQNAARTEPDFQGFEIRDGSGTIIEGVREENQFFLGASGGNSGGIPENDSVGLAQLDFQSAAQQTAGRILVSSTNNQLQTIVDPSTQVTANHGDILNNDHDITRLDSIVSTLQNSVHQLAATDTASRFNTHQFRQAALRSTTIDELLTYTPTGGSLGDWGYDSDTDTGITLEEYAFTGGVTSLPDNLNLALSRRLQSIYSGFALGGQYQRTNASGTIDTVTWADATDIQFVSQSALITFYSATARELTIPLQVVDVNGGIIHRLVDPYPVDVAFTPARIAIDYFVNDVITTPDTSSIVLDNTTPEDVLRIPMTEAQRATLIGAAANIAETHFVDEAAGPQTFFIASTAVGPNVEDFAGFEYADVTLSNRAASGGVRTTRGSNVLVVIEGATQSVIDGGDGDSIEILYSASSSIDGPADPALDRTLWQENSSFSGLPVPTTETNIFRLSYDEDDTGQLTLNNFNFRNGTGIGDDVITGGWPTTGLNVFLRARLDATEQANLRAILNTANPLDANVVSVDDVTVTMTHARDASITATYRVTEASLANGDTSLRVDPVPVSSSGVPTTGNTFQFDFTRFDRVDGSTVRWEAKRINNGPWNVTPVVSFEEADRVAFGPTPVTDPVTPPTVATATGTDALAIGDGASAGGNNSVAIGHGVQAASLNEIAIGSNLATNVRVGSYDLSTLLDFPAGAGGLAGSIGWDGDNNRFTFTINGNVVASIGTDGIRAIDNINDPTPEN